MFVNNKRKVMLDLFKMVLSFLVIYHHSFDIDNMYVFSDIVMGGQYILRVFLYTFTNITVPCFFMISGMLLIGKVESHAKQMKRILKYILILLIFSIFAYRLTIWNYEIGIKGNLYYFCKLFIQDSVSKSYWYLYSYIFVLILLPVIRKCVNAISVKDFLIVVALFLCIICIPETIYAICGLNIKNSILANMEPVLGRCILFFVGGYYLSINKEKVAMHKSKYYIGFIIVTVVLILCIVMFNGESIEDMTRIAYQFPGYNSLFVIAYGLIVFCIFLCHEGAMDSCGIASKRILGWIGAVTLEIYLLGDIMLYYVCPYFKQNTAIQNLDLCVLLVSVISWLLALGIGSAIRLIKIGAQRIVYKFAVVKS